MQKNPKKNRVRVSRSRSIFYRILLRKEESREESYLKPSSKAVAIRDRKRIKGNSNWCDITDSDMATDRLILQHTSWHGKTLRHLNKSHNRGEWNGLIFCSPFFFFWVENEAVQSWERVKQSSLSHQITNIWLWRLWKNDKVARIRIWRSVRKRFVSRCCRLARFWCSCILPCPFSSVRSLFTVVVTTCAPKVQNQVCVPVLEINIQQLGPLPILAWSFSRFLPVTNEIFLPVKRTETV